MWNSAITAIGVTEYNAYARVIQCCTIGLTYEHVHIHTTYTAVGLFTYSIQRSHSIQVFGGVVNRSESIFSMDLGELWTFLSWCEWMLYNELTITVLRLKKFDSLWDSLFWKNREEKYYVKLKKICQIYPKTYLSLSLRWNCWNIFFSSRTTKRLYKKNRRPPIQLSCRLVAFVEFFKICTIVNIVEILTQSEEAFPMTHCWHTGSIVHLSLCVTRQHTCIGGFYSFFLRFE